jgi:ppGpp synthetase/RelA/SpoT-type nucleotidyltranferase
MIINQILSEYDSRKPSYTSMLDSLEEHVFPAILTSKRRGIQSIVPRLKTRDSLERKIRGKSYSSISEITDIVALRIISYFEDDVEEIGRIIASEFKVDKDNSVNKSLALGDREFGYKSLHYVVELGEDRCRMTEYAPFTQIKFEVQIRSILQHAWAEIEHDLGYKSEQAVPSDIRRRFSRLAGLLELADEEFINIRRRRNKYVDSIQQKVSNPRNAKDIEVNYDSIKLFNSSQLVLSISQEINSAANSSSKNFEVAEDNLLNAYVYVLIDCNIMYLNQLEVYIINNREEIIRFARAYLISKRISLNDERTSLADIGMFYTIYHIILASNNEPLLLSYVAKANISSEIPGIGLDFVLFEELKAVLRELRGELN